MCMTDILLVRWIIFSLTVDTVKLRSKPGFLQPLAYYIQAVMIIAIYFSDVEIAFCFVEVEHIQLNKSLKRLILLWRHMHDSRTNLLFLAG